MALATPYEIMFKIRQELGSRLPAAVTTVNTEMSVLDGDAPTLPNPSHYFFGDRLIDKTSMVGRWVVCIIYDSKTTTNDQPNYREEDWFFAVVGIIRSSKQVHANKYACMIEDALTRALDAAGHFGMTRENIKDVEIAGSGVGELDLTDNVYFTEAAVKLRFRAIVCR